MPTSTFERRCDSKNGPRGSVEAVVVDEEAVGEVLVEVVEGREVEGEENDRRECVGVDPALVFFYSVFPFSFSQLLVPSNPCIW
jgi:hypothetical protein